MTLFFEAIWKFICGVAIGYCVAMVLILKLRYELLNGENRILQDRMRLMEIRMEEHDEQLTKEEAK